MLRGVCTALAAVSATGALMACRSPHEPAPLTVRVDAGSVRGIAKGRLGSFSASPTPSRRPVPCAGRCRASRVLGAV
ncbi:hypothetical protein ACFQY7_44225 [Actinomadura luteofluorescens]|uniref:hypothetical protein n=1 Tax=Actinomadura luteofluorescens TaxID=46163 RepID=UPI003641C9D9